MIVTRFPGLIRRDRPGAIRQVGESRFGRVLARPRRLVSGPDRFTLFQCSFDGPDGSTDFKDDAGRHTITAVGDAKIVRDQSKFGGASGLFDGTGDYLELPDHDDWSFGAGDFTIEGWVRPNNVAANQGLVSQKADANNSWYLWLRFAAPAGIEFDSYSGGVQQVGFNQGSNAGWSVGTWYHVALVRNGNDFKIYRDGTSVASTTSSNAIPELAAVLQIGLVGPTSAFNGHLDEWRISNVARYTGDFSPPSKAFPG